MSETSERIITYCIGGIAGIAAGLILMSTESVFLNYISEHCFVAITLLLGLLGASIFTQHKKESAFARSKKIRDETVALITHEMRTGLTSTAWAIEVILENYKKVISNEHRAMLEDVTKSINTKVMHSVNLLDISLLDIGKLVISLKWTQLLEVEKLIVEILEKYKMTAQQKHIDLDWDITVDKTEWIEIDSLRLRITIENLLENALQYTIGDLKKIHVVVTNNAYELQIKISDTGIGIPEAEKGKIFSEFFRASNARKVLSTGSGIGLHMCYQYTLAHHGKIKFESEENGGTTFFITIPLKTSANVNDFLDKI